MNKQYYSYDVEEYPFNKVVTDLFGSGPLSKLHEIYTHPNVFTMQDNSNTIFHDKFYEDMRNGGRFIRLYENFINEHVRSLLKTDFVYQASPTLRVHFHGNLATPEFHVDTQDGYNHPYGEINFILPLTKCLGNNSVWVETTPGSRKFLSIEMQEGVLFGFNGGELMHGNKLNDTGLTRVSFDFRVLPIDKYDEKYHKTSATRGTKFLVGHYYKELR